MRRVIVGILLLVVTYLLVAPVPIDPRPWTPAPNAGLVGPFAPNSLMTMADSVPVGAGPEDVTVGPDGAIYTGLADGRIVRIDRATGATSNVGRTDGRPLGLRFDRAGNLIIADAVRGLVSLAPGGAVTVLADRAGGKPFRFTDAVDIAPDGMIYFSDASQRWGVETGGLFDFWESRPTGRLIRYDPTTGAATVLRDSLDFANGVAVGPEGGWLLLNETMAGRIWRVWLAGPRSGEVELFVDGLPGMPDNIGYDGRGTFWVGLFAPRAAFNEKIRSLAPFLRKMIYRIPPGLRPSRPPEHGMVLGIDTTGRVRWNIQDPTGRYHATTGGVTAGDTLYVSTLTRDVLARLPLPPPR